MFYKHHSSFFLFLAIYVRLQQIVDVMSGRSAILTTFFLDKFIRLLSRTQCVSFHK